MLFADYFDEWIHLYKVGVVRDVTFQKYLGTLKSLRQVAPDLTMEQLTKREYQKLINKYADNHAKQTTKDFHAQLQGAIRDAVDEGLIAVNPCRKVEFKNNPQKTRPPKFLSVDEAKRLVNVLDLERPLYVAGDIACKDAIGRTYTSKGVINWDYLILLCLKTGLRFSEALGVTPNDFNFETNVLNINKTFDYKFKNQLVHELKTKSCERKIILDSTTAETFSFVTDMENDKPIFVNPNKYIHNSTVLGRLRTLCKQAQIPEIGIHGLRHTHASILLYNGISLNSISRRLGHAKPSITQDTYLHIIKELEDIDNDKILAALA